MSDKPATHEILIKQYLRSMLDISACFRQKSVVSLFQTWAKKIDNPFQYSKLINTRLEYMTAANQK